MLETGRWRSTIVPRRMDRGLVVEDVGLMEYRVFPASLESTLVKEKKRQFDPTPDYVYQIAALDAGLVCEQHQEAKLKGRCGFSVLSIDAEGFDLALFVRIHERGCRFEVVILEISEKQRPHVISLGYKEILRSGYNMVFVPKAERSA
ncbi:unnamed protein product [Effrenium voratum]|nr:unnamed protein product [Effrenium voratum]